LKENIETSSRTEKKMGERNSFYIDHFIYRKWT